MLFRTSVRENNLFQPSGECDKLSHHPWMFQEVAMTLGTKQET